MTNRNNKTYNPELFDLYRESNQAAADELFGSFEPAAEPQSAPESANVPPQQSASEPAAVKTQSELGPSEPEKQNVPEQEPAATGRTSADIPLSRRNPGMRNIMGEDPVRASAVDPAAETAEIESFFKTTEETDDPMIREAEAGYKAAQESAHEAPQTAYRPPLMEDVYMDTKSSGARKPQAPDPSMNAGAFAYSQDNPKQTDYSYEALLRPQANYNTYAQKTVSVHSPKGGVGKSTISKELAWAFSLGEVNGQKIKVLLVDADWGFGDQSTLFNVNPNPNLAHWAKRIISDQKRDYEAWQKEAHAPGQKYEPRMPRYDKMTIRSFVLPITENLDLLAAPKSGLDKDLITVDIMKIITANLKFSDYDVIIYDNKDTLKDPRTFVVFDVSDRIFLIDTLDMMTIGEIAEMLQDLREKSFDLSKISLVINNVPNDIKKQDITPEQIVDAFELNYSTQIPEQTDMRLTNNAAEAAMFARKDTPYTKAIKHMANEILPVYPEKTKGLFAKLFSK